jgi:hypothetical protein
MCRGKEEEEEGGASVCTRPRVCFSSVRTQHACVRVVRCMCLSSRVSVPPSQSPRQPPARREQRFTCACLCMRELVRAYVVDGVNNKGVGPGGWGRAAPRSHGASLAVGPSLPHRETCGRSKLNGTHPSSCSVRSRTAVVLWSHSFFPPRTDLYVRIYRQQHAHAHVRQTCTKTQRLG